MCLYVKDCFPLVHLKELENHNFETLWIILKPNHLPRGLNSIVIEIVYHPLESNDKALQKCLTESLDHVLTRNPGAGILLCGDFNQFNHNQLCNSFNLKQVVKHATRGSNILNKVFTNISKFYNSAEIVAPIGYSDHNSVVFKPLKSGASLGQCV